LVGERQHERHPTACKGDECSAGNALYLSAADGVVWSARIVDAVDGRASSAKPQPFRSLMRLYGDWMTISSVRVVDICGNPQVGTPDLQLRAG
jgi:hypothetical protein